MAGSKHRPSVLYQHSITTVFNLLRKTMAKQDNSIESGYHLHSKKLGEGGFGVVRLATHLATNQKVAIKIINKKKVAKDLFRVKTEIAALKVLRHKNIAKLLQVVENDDHIYLVMEYCCGGELFDYLVSRSRLNDSESKRIVRSLVRVLAYIHEKGFAHRDIKPENILLDSTHNIKLIDFGLAANSETTGDLDGLSTCCGSPAYVAPELLMGMKYSGPAADVWSTGVLLYTLVCGKLPFCDNNLAVLYKKIKMGIYEIPSFVHKDTRDLIRKILCVDPKKRITLQEIMEHPWFCTNTFNFHSIGVKLSDLIMKDDESDIDDQILLKCAVLFPNCKDLKLLKVKILNDYGYETAAYWLIKKNPSQFKDLAPLARKEALSRRRSRSFSDFNSPKTKVIAIEEAGKAVPGSVADKNKNNVNCLAKDAKLENIKLPKTDIKLIDKLNQRKMATATKNIVPINKKLFNDLPNDTAHPQTIEDFNLPPIPPSSSNESDKENCNSPFKNKSVDHPKTSSSETMTPKKSLIKRILESATPRKTSSPKKFSTQDKNFSAKNIMITNFTDVDECLEAIIQTLSSKHVNCKAKNYSIRCVLSSMNVIIVAFDLELMVCRTTGFVGIQRKRLRGTSWDYVKICDELNNVRKTCDANI